MAFDPNGMIPPGARIKVIGVGGGGGNAINTMIRANLEGVEFCTANTDVQSLRLSLAPSKIQLGRELTKGLGAGADPDIGRDAALEDRHAIQEAISDADMVFITAGMGGGTGTGGASVISQIAREMGALTVAVVTKPFLFEGKRRQKQAELGIQRLRETVDTLITIPNQRLLQVASPDLTMMAAFNMADNVLLNAVKGISDIINIPGTINVDFADVKTVMSSMGQALMGIGSARGPNRAAEAARQAISSPLLEDVDIVGATGILINISAGSNVTLMEVNEACSIIQEASHEDANIIFGAVIDEGLADEIRVTVIATGFPTDREHAVNSGKLGSLNSVRRATESSYHYQSTPTVRVEARPSQPVAPVTQASILTEEVASQTVETPSSKLASPVANDSVELSFGATSTAEAQDLARWTMGELSASTLGDALQLEAETLVDSVLEELTAPPAEPHNQQQLVISSVEGFGLNIEPPVEREERRVGASASPASFAPLTSDEPELSLFDGSNLDEKIDEALELAERLRSNIDIVDDEEFLDIPAFLRNTGRDLGMK
jgi:cell division protein FtsZ